MIIIILIETIPTGYYPVENDTNRDIIIINGDDKDKGGDCNGDLMMKMINTKEI